MAIHQASEGAKKDWLPAENQDPSREYGPTAPASGSDNRRHIQLVLNNVILHLHPTTIPAPALRFTYTWGLGGISFSLVCMLVLTGILLMFRYDADVERAYPSILALETEVAFGSLIRAVHHWSANLLVVTVGLHLVRVFLTGSFKQRRGVNWIVGLALLLIVLSANFSGYLLPWDQLAYWAITVSTSLFSYIPLIGEAIGNFVLAGPEVGQNALRNFYSFHVAVFPLTLAVFLSYHFWKIRKSDGISQPARSGATRPERLTTIPHLISREFSVLALVVVGILIWSMFNPAPLQDMANPVRSPNPAKAAWYFAGLQELLLHMDALAAIALVGLILAGLVILPKWDRQAADVGIYFRSSSGKKAAFLGAALSLVCVPLLVVVDEYWLNLPALLPAIPTGISTGVIPFFLTILGLGSIYLIARLAFKANHSEGLLALFVFLAVSLAVLTVIGVYFRGPNMALVLPF